MNKTNEQSNNISSTIGDTLSSSARKNLHRKSRSNQEQPHLINTYGRSLATKAYEISNQWHQSDLRRHIKNNPVKATGLVLLTGLVIHSIFNRKG